MIYHFRVACTCEDLAFGLSRDGTDLFTKVNFAMYETSQFFLFIIIILFTSTYNSRGYYVSKTYVYLDLLSKCN